MGVSNGLVNKEQKGLRENNTAGRRGNILNEGITMCLEIN
jgi:hypothetical protein